MMLPYCFSDSSLNLTSFDENRPFSQQEILPANAVKSSILVGKRVVVVEDEGITQLQLRRLLKSAGMIVLASAISGEEGVEVALRERPDLVLMDISMPGAFDGLEAARRILEQYHVCIVMLTAYSEDKYRERASAIKTSGYCLKPITTEILLPALEEALRNFSPH